MDFSLGIADHNFRMKMLRFFGGVFALGVILGGGLRFFPIFPPFRALWLLQLVVSELGLVLAFPLAIMTLTVARKRSNYSVLSIVSPIAFGIALLPVFETIAQERNWIWDLQYGMGRDAKPDPRRHSPYSGDITRPLFEFGEFFRLPAHPLALREEFETPDHARLPLYIYLAAGTPGTPRPWIMSIHGGGWSNGDPRDLDQTIPDLVAAGYNVVAPSYRFSPTYTWPRQMEDVETAYRYAIANAARFNLDPKQLWLLGRSAGGQVALKLAYGSKVLENVKGVIALYTPTDLDFGYRWAFENDVLDSRKLLQELVGTTPDKDPEKFRAASPLADVSVNSPPTLLISGRPDPLVWFRHADRLADRLKEAKVRVTKIELPWATHGFDYFPNSPGGQIAKNAILRFIESP